MNAVNVPILIPTYDPTERIIAVVSGLVSVGFKRLVIVDDGSRPECAPIFLELAEMPQCTVLHHDVNRGKGRGLKTGFTYILEHLPDCPGVVTTDDDGQHAPEDILRCAEKMQQTGRAVLGARDFSCDDVPPRSRFGNNCTRFVFRALCGIKITDTQTGLRALPLSYLPALTKLSGERFEYETNMLLEMKRLGLPFDEVKIQTIYNDKNSGSHFHPLRDSIKIYAVIFKFMLSSGLCSLIDIGLFTLINLLTAPLFGNEELRILTATVGARVVSSLVNFLVNRNGVFRSGKNIRRAAVRYYTLATCQLGVSWLCVSGLAMMFGGGASIWQTLIKIIVDTVLFFISFGIQRDWVYAD